MGLIEILETGGSQHIAAISLLGEGYSMWQYYIPEPAKFLDQLFRLSLPALTLDKKSQVDAISVDSLQAFTNIANTYPKLYIEFFFNKYYYKLFKSCNIIIICNLFYLSNFTQISNMFKRLFRNNNDFNLKSFRSKSCNN